MLEILDTAPVTWPDRYRPVTVMQWQFSRRAILRGCYSLQLILVLVLICVSWLLMSRV
ncbi:hypothetical protein Mapa_012491 [Marchantia paleacea]|nr:hypothetical protein Mapa_012491 [Marchantia paleacea]